MALGSQAAAEAKKWRFVTTTGGVRAIVVPDGSAGESPIEYFGVNVADALSKCSGWDDWRSNRGKTANGVR